MGLQARLFLGMAPAAMVFFQLPCVGAVAAPAGSDAVILWNANAGVAATKACLAPFGEPFHESRIYAMMHIAIHDALNAIDRRFEPYTFDKKKAPQTLDDLVAEGYLRAVPIDPITGSDQTWRKIVEDSLTAVDQTQPGIFDVRSGSDLTSLEGTPYSEW